MEPLRLPLDTAARHHLVLEGRRLTLRHSAGSKRSPLHEALNRHLRLVVGGAAFDLREAEKIEIPADCDALAVTLGDLRLAEVRLAPGPSLAGDRYLLSPFECRFLAENGLP